MREPPSQLCPAAAPCRSCPLPRLSVWWPPHCPSAPPHSETLPVEYLGGKPLCMNQYYQILSSCRVPGPKQDTVISFSKTKKPPMHITVVHNYQVGGLPAGCRGGGGQGQRSAAPPPPAPHRTCPRGPRNRHLLGVSAGCPSRPQPEGSQEGPWACPAWERAMQGPLPLSYLWPGFAPSAGPGPAGTDYDFQAAEARRRWGWEVTAASLRPPPASLLSTCLCPDSFLSWTCTTAMGLP